MAALTEKQAAFVLHYTTAPGCIGNAAGAARAAGYSESTAKEQGHRIVNLPHVRAAIDEANRAQISGALSTKAVQRLEMILDDEKAPPKLWLDAAKTVLDRAGIIAPKADEPERPAQHKKLAEMSIDDLQEFIATEKARRAEAASAQAAESALCED